MSETPHFGPVDFPAPPAGERADRYRALAAQHVDLSRVAPGDEARAAHLELAALWTRLAAQAQHQVLEDRPAAGTFDEETDAPTA
jgi:hypothetical protein